MSPEEQRAKAEAEMIWMMSLGQESRVQMLSGMFGAMRNMDTYTRTSSGRLCGKPSEIFAARVEIVLEEGREETANNFHLYLS